MDPGLIAQFAREVGIAPEHLAREEHELLLLRGLLEQPVGDRLVFKGGTALRLAYGSPRFSDDLDFSATAAIGGKAFRQAAEAAMRGFPQITLVEALAKRFTLLAVYRIRAPAVPPTVSIRVEVSTRPEPWNRGRDLELRLLTSPVTPVTVLAHVATLDRLWTDKVAAFADRREPRDLYDLWFLAQKLRREFVPNLEGLDMRVLRRQLRKYLPRAHWPVIEPWST
jgi:predicted nucleotidyltransferase component of viral defense system